MLNSLFGDSSFSNARVWAFLKTIDAAEAETYRSAGCPRCGGELHSPTYPRKPHGLAPELRDDSRRFSFCCAACRRRVSPPSSRFFGRRFRVAPLFLVVSVLMLAGTRQPEPREGQAGPAGWRRGPQYRGSRVMPAEGTDDRRQTGGGRHEPVATEARERRAETNRIRFVRHGVSSPLVQGPRDLMAAIRRVVHLSVETMRIVGGLPEPFDEGRDM